MNSGSRLAVATVAVLAALTLHADPAAAASADMAVQKTVNTPKPNVGDTVTFTITVTNGGPDTATGVSAHDALPAGMSFVSAAPSQGTFDSGTGLWSIGTVTTSVAMQVKAVVASPNESVNTVTVTADQADPTMANNTASVTVTPQRADLAIAKTVDIPTPHVGDTVTFTVSLTDRGPDPANGVQVTDLLPTGLQFVSATSSQGAYSSGSGLWTVGTVATANPATIRISAMLKATGRVVNTATITNSEQFDPDTSNNTASLTVPRTPTLTTLSSSVNPVPFGQPFGLLATVAPPPDGGTVTFTADALPLSPPLPVETVTGTAIAPGIASLTAGSHSIVASYSGDADYLPSASAPLTQVVSAPPWPGPIPSLSHLAVSPSSFAALRSGPSAVASKRRRAGARVYYTLSGAAQVTFTVTRSRHGRQVAIKGAFTQSGRQGRNGFRFTGRLAGRALAPGAYRLVATPSAGGLSGSPATAGFRIAGSKKRAG